MLSAERKLEVWRLALEPDPDLYRVAALTATIPDTAAACVRFANSSYVGAVSPVGSVLEAVVRLGCRQAGAIAMASITRDLTESWGTPEMWEDALTIGRAAKMIGRLLGLGHTENEQLFVAGLFSCVGSGALVARDAGYLAWRSRQWVRGITEQHLLERERMAFGEDHMMASARVLDDWNLPTPIIAAVASHHRPTSTFEQALWAAMLVLPPLSVSRCADTPFEWSMAQLGLRAHAGSVEAEAARYAEAVAMPEEPARIVPGNHLLGAGRNVAVGSVS